MVIPNNTAPMVKPKKAPATECCTLSVALDITVLDEEEERLCSKKPRGKTFAKLGARRTGSESGRLFIMYYAALAEIPVPTSAQFLGSDTAQVRYSVRNHVRNVNTTLIKTITGLLADDGPYLSPLLDFDLVASVVSPSGKRRAVLREVKSGATQGKRFVEVWCGDILEASVDVSEKHGAFYADEYLSSLAFSPSELALVYTAESNQPKSDNPYDRFRFRPDFGEGLDGKKRPTTFVLRWKPSTPENDSFSIALLPLSIPTDICLGQAIFSPNSENIIYGTGYEYTRDGRMLGLKGCYNRPTGIWQVVIKTDSTEGAACVLQKLTASHLACRSPRSFFSAGSSTLLWLSCKTGGAHVSTSTLHVLDITSDRFSIDPAAIEAATNPIVDVVMNPIRNTFPGLYPAYNMPYSPIVKLQSQPHILVSSTWGSRSTILLVSVENGSVRDLTPANEELFSWSILATDGSCRIICSRSSSSIPYEVVLATLDGGGDVAWRVLDKPMLPEQVANILSTIRTSIIEVPGRYPTETVVVQSTNPVASSVAPCITVPHGGPHGTTTTAFAASTTAMVLEGYTLSLPNYTGSLGFGESSIKALIGNCGTLDVQDCIASVRHLVSLGVAELGPGKQFVMGGSHGGFLTAHLIGQYPGIFSAAVMRNPVVSSGEISTSDIPDWYYSEFGLDYPVSSSVASSHLSEPGPIPLMSAESFSKLRAASPIAHIDAITVPVLLLIGDADRRVAPTQGIEFYHALRAHFGSEGTVEMLVFEGESHPLDGVEASKVMFEAARDWFSNCTNKISNLM